MYSVVKGHGHSSHKKSFGRLKIKFLTICRKVQDLERLI